MNAAMSESAAAKDSAGAQKKARPYYLLGRQRLAQLETQVHAALLPVLERWHPRTVSLTVDIDNFYAAENLSSRRAHYFAHGDDAWLALFSDEHANLVLAEGWLGCKVATLSELIQTLLRTFFGELFSALAATTALNDAAPLRDVAHLSEELTRLNLPAANRPGAGTLLLRIAIGSATLEVLTSAALWPALAEQPPRRATNQLTPCNAALGDCRVQIDALLPSVRLPLTAIAGLAVGDFLNLRHDLSGALELRGSNVALTLLATVGRQGELKAIRLGGD
jgi:hypothetical protein